MMPANVKDERVRDGSHQAYIDVGMSLRDWFAGQALCGAMARTDVEEKWTSYARAAYAVADAMLSERVKTKPSE